MKRDFLISEYDQTEAQSRRCFDVARGCLNRDHALLSSATVSNRRCASIRPRKFPCFGRI